MLPFLTKSACKLESIITFSCCLYQSFRELRISNASIQLHANTSFPGQELKKKSLVQVDSQKPSPGIETAKNGERSIHPCVERRVTGNAAPVYLP